MKNLILITIFILTISCGSIKNTSELINADEKFELCSNLKYNRLITEVGPVDGKLIYKQNVHSLLENLLIQENYLTEISKNGYIELLEKTKRKEIRLDFFGKVKTEFGFNPYSLFLTSSHLSCYGYIIEQLNIIDKTSWQHEFALAYNKFEASGDLNSNNEFIIEALNKIPKDKFEMIMYRKLFLDLIYTQLN